MISFHFQSPVTDWPRAVRQLPAGTPVKAVNNAQILREAKLNNQNILTIHREWYDGGQTFDGAPYSTLLARARAFFRSFVNPTFRELSPYVDVIETWNETIAESQTAQEKQWRVDQERAMCEVWASDYAASMPHIKLCLANTAVGNSIPIGFAQLASQYGHYLGYHGYVAIYGSSASFDVAELATAENRPNFRSDKLYIIPDIEPVLSFDTDAFGSPVPGEWNWCSGRFAQMDAAYKAAGIEVKWLITEGGPVRSVNGGGVLDPQGGWRHSGVCGGNDDCYVDIMRYWATNAAAWNRANKNRCRGVTLFTTGGGSSWVWFETAQPTMDKLANLAIQFPPGGSTNPPPTPCTIPINRRRQILHPQTLSPAQEYQIAMWRRDGIPSALLGMTGPNVPVGVMGYSHEDLISAVLQAIQQQPESMLIVVDGDQIGTGLTPQWLQTYCPTVASTAKFLTTFRLKSWPVPSSTVTQRFGLNTANYAQFGYPGHSGVDLAGNIGDPIKAMAAGVVDDVGYAPDGFGHYAWIASSHNGMTYRIVYAHMNTASPLVVGQTVSVGQQVGVVGNTGNSFGSHLHVELRIPGYTYKQVNGQTWIRNVHDISMWLAALKPTLF